MTFSQAPATTHLHHHTCAVEEQGREEDPENIIRKRERQQNTRHLQGARITRQRSEANLQGTRHSKF